MNFNPYQPPSASDERKADWVPGGAGVISIALALSAIGLHVFVGRRLRVNRKVRPTDIIRNGPFADWMEPLVAVWCLMCIVAAAWGRGR